MKAFEGQTLSFALEHEVLDVRLHREPCNEIGTEMLAELERVADAINTAGVRAMVLGSDVARGFSAGADLRELHRRNQARRDAAASDADRALEVRGFLDRIHRVFDAFDRAPFTTVAAVHGVCFGGGFELALTCDLIVADRTARFCFPELRLGLIPGFGGVPRLSRIAPNGLVRDLLLTGRSLGAARAHELGLVSQLTSEGEHRTVAHRVAQQARRFDALATARCKELIKTFPTAELEREKDIFCELFARPVVDQALARFDKDEGPLPYLPESPEPRA